MIDPNNMMLHRVPLAQIEMLKAGRLVKVQATCGKVWTPSYPVNREHTHPKCPVCFPPEVDRYAIAK